MQSTSVTGKLDVPLRLGVVKLGPFDDDQMRGKVDSPREGRGAHEHHDGLRDEQALNGRPVALAKPSMMDAHPKRKRVLEGTVLDGRE